MTAQEALSSRRNGRVGRWRGGLRLRFHPPLIEPCRRISRTRLSDKALPPAAHVGWSAAGRSGLPGPLNHQMGVRRLAPISRLSAPSARGLELGSLPSAGVTRPHRYYEPLRHPERPGLSLAGVRLSSRDSPQGASRVASDLLPGMPSPLPRWDHWFASLPGSCPPIPQ
jgi:hypothetical protein